MRIWHWTIKAARILEFIHVRPLSYISHVKSVFEIVKGPHSLFISARVRFF